MAEAKTKKAAPAKTAAAAPPEGERCKIEKCMQPLRAKGFCRKHYIGWRRADVGTKHRYKTCSHEACNKKVVKAGRCGDHQKNAPAAVAA